MRISLSNEHLYADNYLVLDSRANYIFGKNGTGKSTLTRLIEDQYGCDYDIRIFQGFKSIIGSDDKLDAVVLGEENNAIKKQIEAEEKEIEKINGYIRDLKVKITPPEKPDPEKNLASKLILAEKERDSLDKKMTSFYTDAARRIKQRENPSISDASYNKGRFAKDVDKAEKLTDKEREQCTKTLMSEVKEASSVFFPTIELAQMIDDVNEVLATKVEEKVVISRLEDDPKKRNFASMGMQIHKKGDVCAFCGNVIKDEEYDKLESYFSADETKELQRRIKSLIEYLESDKEGVNGISIDPSEFYPEYLDEVRDINERLLKAIIEYNKIFETMNKALTEKLMDLFVEHDKLVFDSLPDKMRDFDAAYKAVRSKNNASDLAKKQSEAKEKLRLDAVKCELDDFDYAGKENELDRLDKNVKNIEKEIQEQQDQINEQQEEIRKRRLTITKLQQQTSSEQRLADNINQKISRMVDFQLEHYEDYDQKGYYRIKDLETGESRPVLQLSTGEKNLIAFLYFIEKLDEIREDSRNRPKLIIFDDPMNSNDESMQYLIVDELKDLVYRTKKSERDIIITLTHNVGFYSGICNFYKDEEYSDNTIIRLKKEGHQTHAYRITNRRENIKSGYGMNWEDLITIYNDNSIRSETMLNTMRRILESYTSFNGYNMYKFCDCVNGFIDILNSGSHASRDFSGSVNDYDKDALVQMFYDCFKGNNVAMQAEHFWPEIKKIARR